MCCRSAVVWPRPAAATRPAETVISSFLGARRPDGPSQQNPSPRYPCVGEDLQILNETRRTTQIRPHSPPWGARADLGGQEAETQEKSPYKIDQLLTAPAADAISKKGARLERRMLSNARGFKTGLVAEPNCNLLH